jgi:hypothetical protein
VLKRVLHCRQGRRAYEAASVKEDEESRAASSLKENEFGGDGRRLGAAAVADH